MNSRTSAIDSLSLNNQAVFQQWSISES